MKQINEVKAYQCEKCKQAYLRKEQADNHHCTHERKCEDCGKALEPQWYYTICEGCRINREFQKEKDRFEKATKITLAEYESAYPGLIFTDGEDGFGSDADSLADVMADESGHYPTYLWGTTRQEINLDADSIVSMLEEDSNAYEDYEVSESAAEDIRRFVDEFNEKHQDHSFAVNYGVAVLLPEEWIKEANNVWPTNTGEETTDGAIRQSGEEGK